MPHFTTQIVLLAENGAASSGIALALFGCAAIGASLFMLFWWIHRALASEDLKQGDEWRYDVTRINELRRHDWLYRYFQPAIDQLARFNRAVFEPSLGEIQRDLQAAGMSRFWLPEEYLARAELIALLLAPVYLALWITWLGWPGAPLALMMTGMTAWLLRRRLHRLAKTRLTQIKRQMPFFLDLITLLMEAGSTFLHALDEAVGEFAGRPVSVEFGRVLADIRMGKTRTDAFYGLRNRLSDDEVGSIIGSIVQGENLGTPMAQIFRTQADVLRIERTQRAETMAGEAGVTMLLPAVLVMVSSVLIILGPFLLNLLLFGIDF